MLVAVPYYGTTHADQLRERVAEFFDVAARAIDERGKVSYGERPLVAFPLFAHRGGGGGPVVGDILNVLYDEAQLAVARHRIDVVMVLDQPREYDLAQVIRREDARAWLALNAEQARHARRLGAQAAKHRLVPFMGSGVSVTAGTPTWQELISALAIEAGLQPDDAKDLSDKSRDVLDQAAYLHRLFERRYPVSVAMGNCP